MTPEEEFAYYCDKIHPLVNKHFEDDYKTNFWFVTKNPLLGGVKPIDMLKLGRGKKLLEFIETSLLLAEKAE